MCSSITTDAEGGERDAKIEDDDVNLEWTEQDYPYFGNPEGSLDAGTVPPPESFNTKVVEEIDEVASAFAVSFNKNPLTKKPMNDVEVSQALSNTDIDRFRSENAKVNLDDVKLW